jgi:hypothetical protein
LFDRESASLIVRYKTLIERGTIKVEKEKREESRKEGSGGRERRK